MGRKNYREEGVGGIAVPFDSVPSWVRRLSEEIGAREWICTYGTPRALFDWQEEEQRRYEERIKRRREREKERQKRLKEKRKARRREPWRKRGRPNWWRDRNVRRDPRDENR